MVQTQSATQTPLEQAGVIGQTDVQGIFCVLLIIWD